MWSQVNNQKYVGVGMIIVYFVPLNTSIVTVTSHAAINKTVATDSSPGNNLKERSITSTRLFFIYPFCVEASFFKINTWLKYVVQFQTKCGISDHYPV